MLKNFSKNIRSQITYIAFSPDFFSNSRCSSSLITPGLTNLDFAKTIQAAFFNLNTLIIASHTQFDLSKKRICACESFWNSIFDPNFLEALMPNRARKLKMVASKKQVAILSLSLEHYQKWQIMNHNLNWSYETWKQKYEDTADYIDYQSWQDQYSKKLEELFGEIEYGECGLRISNSLS